MNQTLSLGQLRMEICAHLKGQIAFSDLCAPAATLEFSASDGLLNSNQLLFRLTFPGYILEALIHEGMVFIRRNGIHQHSEQYQTSGKYHIAVQWTVDSLSVGVIPWSGIPDAINGHIRGVQTPPTVPPPELIRQLRTQNLLVNSAYNSADDLFLSVLDCLYLCEADIRRMGSERFIWGKGGDPNRPLDEPEITRYVATFLASKGADRNFDVTCDPLAASGNVDFWIVGPVVSAGLAKIAIEAKKADHKDLAHGFTKQLPQYMARLGATHGIFLTYWLKSPNYPHPKFTSYPELEVSVLHPLPRGPGVRTIGMDLSNGPSPSRA